VDARDASGGLCVRGAFFEDPEFATVFPFG
jgi:hypothetical protein